MNERLFYNQLQTLFAGELATLEYGEEVLQQTLFAGELATLEYGEEVLHGVDNLVSWES